MDVSNPNSPTLQGTSPAGIKLHQLAVSGSFVCAVDTDVDSLRVLDITNPTSPVLKGSAPLGDRVEALTAVGNYAYAVDRLTQDLRIIDFINPDSIVLKDSILLGMGVANFPEDVAVAGNYAYVTDQLSDDLKVIQLTCGLSVGLNPTDGTFTPIASSVQDLSLSTNILSLSGDPTTVDLSPYVNTDSQDLSLSANTLSLSGDPTTVDLSAYTNHWTASGGNVFRASGNVGISTTTANMPLSFSTALGNKIALWGSDPLSHYGLGIQGGLLQIYAGAVIDNIAFGYGSSTSFTEVMRIQGNGNVGIGTPMPTRAKVHIEGSTGFTYGQYGFLDGNGNTGPFSGTNPYSLYASNFIMAGQVHAFSDARIKNIMGPSNSQSDLNTLMDIQITDYQYIDTIQKGAKLQKKVIAQQVAEVFPEAVSSTVTDVVPDIYQRATVADGWIQLATDLQVGERVKIITKTSSQIHEVTAVEAQRFQVTPLSTDHSALSNVFVYGREVDDFHVVDYEAISMLNVSATQELARKVEVLEEENTQLRAEIKKMEALKTRLQDLRQLEQRLSQIEALLPSTTQTNQ
ncbi:MAG: tail fiber domain-containing protein [Bacteroidota bacterium]